MTTIAYRDGVLAADTRTNCSVAIDGIVKIVAIKKGRLAGALAAATGTAGYMATFLRWAEGGCEGEPPVGEDVNGDCDAGLIFDLDGEVINYEPSGRFTMRAPYYAAGSGVAVALGAMHAGADAESAVRAAIAHDPHTGGEVTVLRHKEPQYAPPVTSFSRTGRLPNGQCVL